MYITLNEDNFIKAVSWGGVLDDGIEVEDFEFKQEISAYRYKDGEIILDKNKLTEIQEEQAIQQEIEELQEFLNATDYVILRQLEEEEFGRDKRGDYEDIMNQRRAARAKIYQLRGDGECE